MAHPIPRDRNMLRFVATWLGRSERCETSPCFSVRDLRLSSSELVREAEAGQVSIITKRGKPAVLALPFGSRLLEMGVDKDLALALFERRLITMAKAANLAGVTQDVFMDLVAEGGLVAVDYPAEELADELRVEI